MKTVFTYGGKNPFAKATTKDMITVTQSEARGRRFTVTYGLQVESNLTYSKACSEIGRAILHHACCQGLADNDGD